MLLRVSGTLSQLSCTSLFIDGKSDKRHNLVLCSQYVDVLNECSLEKIGRIIASPREPWYSVLHLILGAGPGWRWSIGAAHGSLTEIRIFTRKCLLKLLVRHRCESNDRQRRFARAHISEQPPSLRGLVSQLQHQRIVDFFSLHSMNRHRTPAISKYDSCTVTRSRGRRKLLRPTVRVQVHKVLTHRTGDASEISGDLNRSHENSDMIISL